MVSLSLSSHGLATTCLGLTEVLLLVLLVTFPPNDRLLLNLLLAALLVFTFGELGADSDVLSISS